MTFRQGPCGMCGKSSEYLERDHRVPPRLGGSQHPDNIQRLCPECHTRKTSLEINLFDINTPSEDIEQWLTFAFQHDTEQMELFIIHVSMQAAHFKECYKRLMDEHHAEDTEHSK
jgi:hypothetical protein